MNTNTTPTHQARVMHTYEVLLDGPANSCIEHVNLSYELNDALEPVDRNGTVVPPSSIAARIEVRKRLHKLAQRGATTVPTAIIEDDDTEWAYRLVRTSFIRVALDEDGRPIPHRQ